MRLSRLIHSMSFALGTVLVLSGVLFLLTDKIVIYPSKLSLPLLSLNSVEQQGFNALHQIRGLEPRQAVSPPAWASWTLGATGLLICFLSGSGIWTQTQSRQK
ncbi:hypothetical protein GC176_08895 [bacterium]|nr:hypothetical protein [bacterium]